MKGMGWAAYVTRMEELEINSKWRSTEIKGKDQLEYTVKERRIILHKTLEMGREHDEWNEMVQDMVQWRTFVSMLPNHGIRKVKEPLGQPNIYELCKEVFNFGFRGQAVQLKVSQRFGKYCSCHLQSECTGGPTNQPKS
jgi:hypothetical protein